MKSGKWPITIANQRYSVDKNFVNEPAIFGPDHPTWKLLHERIGLDNNSVIILAHQVYTSICSHCEHKHEDIHNTLYTQPKSSWKTQEEAFREFGGISVYITTCPECNKDYYHD
jgi:hypothetical protein